MDQLDQRVAENILREMTSAAMDLDTLAAETGFSKRTLVRRLGEGNFRARDLAKIARALRCPPAALWPEEAA